MDVGQHWRSVKPPRHLGCASRDVVQRGRELQVVDRPAGSAPERGRARRAGEGGGHEERRGRAGQEGAVDAGDVRPHPASRRGAQRRGRGVEVGGGAACGSIRVRTDCSGRARAGGVGGAEAERAHDTRATTTRPDRRRRTRNRNVRTAPSSRIRPVSSASSRTAHASTVSPPSSFPPGTASGRPRSARRRPSSTRPSALRTTTRDPGEGPRGRGRAGHAGAYSPTTSGSGRGAGRPAARGAIGRPRKASSASQAASCCSGPRRRVEPPRSFGPHRRG